MAYLLLDSSNTSLSVGFENNGFLAGFTSYEAWQIQSEHMVPEIDALMKKLGLTRDDIKGIVTSIGPGSYTGVRIALTIAKVTSLATGAPIYPVSSLQVLKDGDKPSICLINARSNRSYIGVYDENVILNDQVMTNEEVKNFISCHPDYVICGDTAYLGIEGYKNNIIYEMALLKSKATKNIDALGIKPIYLKD